MKHIPLCRLMLVFSLVLAAPSARATLNSAEITRLYNDVRVRLENTSEREAKLGDKISGKSLIRTGMKSRAELMFNDSTLTRLGANTVFSFERGTRNMEVGSGTLFLQVPKNAGGATINTAAVTAAVTGTTIMFEYDGDHLLKIIVLEGSLDLILNDDSRVKQTLRAGEMIVMPPNARNIPDPVNVDLDLLIKTSKLIDEKEFDKLPPSATSKIADAVNTQEQRLSSGELSKTNLVIPGEGSRVILTDQNFERRLLSYLDGLESEPARLNQDPRPPLDNQFAQITRPVLQPGLWRIADTTVITTNPTITNGLRLGQGTIYVPSLAGSYTQWAFGQPDTASGGKLQKGLNQANAWTVFLLENILVEGTPAVVVNGPRQALFASPNDINFGIPPVKLAVGEIALSNPGGMDLDSMALRSVGFTTQGASINLNGFDISGQGTDFGLFANGPGGDIKIDSRIMLGGGDFIAYAGGMLSTMPGTSIDANHVEMGGRRMVSIDNTSITGNDILIDGGGSVEVSDSSQLSLLTSAAGAGGMIGIRSKNGDVILRGGSSFHADGPMQRLEVEAANGSIRIGDPPQFETETKLSASSLVAFRASGTNQPMILFNSTSVDSQGRIDALARGAGARVRFDGFNVMSAPEIRIFAEGSGSLIRFTGTTQLNGNQVRLAARRILVDPQSRVDVNAPTIGIFANQHDYKLNGNGNSLYGNLNTGQTQPTIGTYDQR